MLNVKDVIVQLGKNIVLDLLNVQFEEASIHGIVGLNGSGKTTFFNTLAGFYKPESGTIDFSDSPLSVKKVAYLETTNYFYPMLTAREYLRIFKQTNPIYEEEALFELFHLPPGQLIEEYSTGMKKRLAMMALLKQDKKLYILDEPFNGLDLEGVFLFEEIMLKLKEQKKTILISSHVIAPLEKVCDTISLLEKGQVQHVYKRENFADLNLLLEKSVVEEIREKLIF